MASKFDFSRFWLEPKRFLSILNVFLILSVILYGCPMQSDKLKFIYKGKHSKYLSIKPVNDVNIQLYGSTMDYGVPGIPISLKIKTEYIEGSKTVFLPEKITAKINGKIMKCRPDSGNFELGSESNFYMVNCGCEFSNEEIEHIRKYGNSIEISLDSFLIRNDTVVHIDTIIANAPRLKSYLKFKQ